MSDTNWEALAEIYIRNPAIQEKDYTYCLCSRAHIKIPTDILAIESEELSESYDVFNEHDCENIATNMNRVAKEVSQEEEDSDANSCYYSASVSHTDNYCTTDEHERDSGADTSEYHAGACGSKDHSKKPTGFEHKCSQERNKSLPDLFGDEQKNVLWEKYWSEYGEQLIWSSWIEKYSDFINPFYKNASIDNTTDDHLSLCSDDRKSNETFERNELNADTEIIVSSCSPEMVESVDRPVPDIHDDATNSDYPIRDLMDSLLIPRCDSVSSSIPLTIGTTDSMTNVTQMTVSSFGYSRVSSENSQLSESTPSSSSPPFNFDGDETRIEQCHVDDPDQHWQTLWQNHFQEQYSEHFHKFIEKQDAQMDVLSSSLQEGDNGYKSGAGFSMNETVCPEETNYFAKKPHSYFVETETECGDDDDAQTLVALGLPTSFGKFSNGAPKRSNYHVPDTPVPDHIKAAFSLMGYSFDNVLGQEKTEGHLTYRKKNIRFHNSFLKLKKRKFYHENCTDDLVIGKPKELGYSSSDETDSTPSIPIKPTTIDAIVTAPLPNDISAPENHLILEAAKTTETDVAKSSINYEHSDEEIQEEAIVKETMKKPKKKRRQNKNLDNMPSEIRADKRLYKYWCKRFSLFSLFDNGIKLDSESWFSVTPEKVAMYCAARCSCDVIVDAFCGAGGNTIQFAKTCRKVIAIDIDPKKIEMAKHNAGIYGVDHCIEFIVGDFFVLAESLKADVVFLSPPWGGPEYLRMDTYDIETALLPKPASELMEAARNISPNIAIYLPRNTNTHQLVRLAGPGKSVELEQGFLDRKLIAITAFYGNLLKNTSN